ncbi:MAG: hypothetical protein O2979_05440 [Proteobacteria bacterium]|nr:hypothetical protein [Pseudomonadota bacterium]
MFDALASRTGLAASLPDKLKDAFRASFEAGMAAYYEYADGDVMRFQRELAHYMAEFVPGRGNAYVRLVEELGLSRCILCTLNYDLLIELSASRLGHNTAYTSAHSPGFLRLLKPHGSCNFWPHMPGITISNSTFKRSGRADIQAPIRPLSQQETINKCVTEDSVAPAIAMYAEGKPVKISPDYVEEQQRMWGQAIAEASRVCVAGAHIHPPDSHIWTPLSKTKAALFYFGLAADRESFGAWQEISKKRNAFFVEADFAAAVPGISRRMM